MEEQVGQLWHRLVTRIANDRYPAAAVALEGLRLPLGILFRAIGGDGGLEIAPAEATEHGARRRLLQRIAGVNRKIQLAWRDDQALRLPAVIDYLPSPALNRDLYFWLAALAGLDSESEAQNDWFGHNQRLTRKVLQRFPGLAPRYRRLVEAHLALRPDPARLGRNEAAAEQAIRQALQEPGSVDHLPDARRPPQPVLLWLHPDPPGAGADRRRNRDEDAEAERGEARTQTLEAERRRAERTDTPEADRGLITIRMENIFTWGEFVNVDRGSEENEDLDQAADIARDIDTLSVSRDNRASAARLKFDLDLPSEASDDRVIGEGILLPEWDYKRQRLLPDHCRIVPMEAAEAVPCELPDRLKRTARRLRAQFQALAPARIWYRGQADGSEIDLEAYLRFRADQAAGQRVSADGLYLDLRQGARDLACLLLADLSLSTDTWVNDHARVIDVIRDSLFLFAESLAATGDHFAMYGFSSRKRDPVRVHTLKTFDEAYSGRVRGRIDAIRPGYYTRMGAAIRHASELLKAAPAERRLLLVLTDGKPNDLDQYEGRYGIEDTRHAIRQARQLGLQPFCVTIDEQGNEYLPHLFGSGGYVVIRKPSELPRELPLLYTRLTA
ncbi:VWA domain-containing protein [Thiohalobacter sp. IOR34]|uniref:nitric oxide reductase activation protein NorD n=1 Tax=Thiohalobacter sp. IOR34 TaxID=3057176 RepID=UPI0025AEE607|nr:VWA domain-containing protein [Thiohalobacter sp. IOR34]WJW75448.1 VWA domain-containing protein [Thiohalobacter sp. IOR34]